MPFWTFVVTQVLLLTALVTLRPFLAGSSGGPVEHEGGGTTYDALIEADVAPDPPAPTPGGDADAVTTAGYVFSDFRLGAVDQPMEGVIRVWFKSAWVGSIYPGAYECTWTVDDGSGTSMGFLTGPFSSMDAVAEPNDLGNLEVPIVGSGTPETASVSCDDNRLDDPDGYYEFTDIEITGYTPSSATVGYAYSWQGSGDRPGAQTCTLRIMSQKGVLLGLDTFNFLALDAVGSAGAEAPTLTDVVDISLETGEVPTTATMTCVPLTAAATLPTDGEDIQATV